MLKKKERLTAEDIQSLATAERAKSVFGTLLSLRFMPADQKRLSVVAAKKVAPRAVDRTRLRRRLYAAVDKPFSAIHKPFHVMVMPKKECATVPFPDLSREVAALFEKARLLGQ